MKMFLSIFAGVLLIFTHLAFIEEMKAENLVKNANFEQTESSNRAKFWSCSKAVYFGKYQLSQEQANSGKNSVKIVGDGSDKNYGFFQRIDGFKAGAKLKITTKLFVKDFKQGRIKAIHAPIIFRQDGVTKKAYPGVWVTPENCQKGKWVSYTFILDLSTHPDVSFIYIWGLGWQRKGKPFVGETYWDDFSIIELPDKNDDDPER